MSEKFKQFLLAPPPERGKAIRTPWKMWPSSASCEGREGKIYGSCLRRCYYDWTDMGVSNGINDFVKMTIEMGLYLEEKTRSELIKKKVYDFEVNKKKNRKFLVDLQEGMVLSSEVDIIIQGKDSAVGMEVKSYSNKTITTKQGPKDNHLIQTFLYTIYYEPKPLYFVIFYRPNPLSKWSTEDVVHEISNKEIDGQIHPVINGEVMYDITLEGILNRYSLTKKAVENKILPIREFKKSDKPCSYCPYKDNCWADKLGVKIT